MELIPAIGRGIAIGDRRFERKLELARKRAILDHPAYQRCEVANAAAFAIQNPAFVVRLLGFNLYNFWGPNSFLLRSVHEGLYKTGPLVSEHYPLFKTWVIASTLGIVGSALLTLGRRGRSPAPAVGSADGRGRSRGAAKPARSGPDRPGRPDGAPRGPVGVPAPALAVARRGAG